eukprot:6473757-Amphidinium_carterae.2
MSGKSRVCKNRVFWTPILGVPAGTVATPSCPFHLLWRLAGELLCPSPPLGGSAEGLRRHRQIHWVLSGHTPPPLVEFPPKGCGVLA